MIYAPWLKLFNPTLAAVTVWKWVLYTDKNPEQAVINHERIHLDQIRRDGALKFYYRYLSEYLKLRILGIGHFLSYRNISYEKEAYDNQHNLDYEVKPHDHK